MKPVAHFQMNDRMIKFTSSRQIRLQHKYLGLPGEVEQRYPTEVVLPNMDSGRIDELYSVNLGFMIDLEEESSVVTEKTLKKYYKYRVFSSYIYCKNVETVVLCKKDPKNFPKEYKVTNSDILRPTYIYFPPEELWEKYENLINKIEHKEVLTEFEAMDMMVIPKYLPKNDAAFATESMANYFKDAIIEDE